MRRGGGGESSRQAIELAEKYTCVWATVGVHPECKGDLRTFGLREILIDLAKRPKVVAIGECGLDYDESPPRESPFGHSRGENEERQRELFEMNVGLARETGLPLVVHCRNAFEDVWGIVNGVGVVGQMHCWTGDETWMKRFVNAGWYISFGGILTFKNSVLLREVAKVVVEDRLLIETDAPYLAPEPVRGSKNTPANVKYVLNCLAEVRGWTAERADKITSENARRLFGVKQ